MTRAWIAAAFIFGLVAPAFAADTKVSNLPSAGPLTGPEQIPCVQGGVTDKCLVKNVSQGVFNVRTMYGAVPDGSTDNSTAITNAFTASNAFTVGIPTVYFDCDIGTTTCQYNYGGSGTSPINPTVGTTIQCAPGVTINYTGTAHALDIGPTGLAIEHNDRYSILGCQFTGGGSYTAGIYVNNYIVNSYIHGNVFYNFGNQTGYTIVYSANNWTPVVDDNYWRDTDGFTKNMIDAHTATNAGLLFTNNKNECFLASGGTCSVSTVGVGVWLVTGWILDSEIKYHYPAIRMSSCQSCGGGAGIKIQRNLLEGNSNGTTPAITFGDPNTAGVHMAAQPSITDNYFYWPVVANIPIIGPETASSGSFNLDRMTLTGNWFSNAPTGTAVYVNTSQGIQGYISNNRKSGGSVDQSSTPTLIDTTFAANNDYFGLQSFTGNGSAIANNLGAFDANGINLNVAGFHNVATTLTCHDTTGNGTTQGCNTTPRVSAGGGTFTPAAHDQIIYSTTTANSGDVTINVNTTSAVHVRKGSGMCVLVTNDIQANVDYLLTYDGTYWEMPSYGIRPCGFTVSTLPATAAAGAVIGNHAYVTDAVACTFQSTPTGGGSTYCPVSYTGAAWVGGG